MTARMKSDVLYDVSGTCRVNTEKNEEVPKHDVNKDDKRRNKEKYMKIYLIKFIAYMHRIHGCYIVDHTLCGPYVVEII